MINITNLPIDVEDVRLWANGYREQHELSWSKFATESGIPSGTLQPFCKGNYQGDNERVARDLFRFRQTVESRTQRLSTVPSDPGYFETETSLRLRTLLQIAHMGNITVAATGPGTGKTMTIRDYAERAQPVWIATMKPSTRRLNAMILEVHKALGMEVKHSWMAGASAMVAQRFKGRSGLLVVDEAQHLETDALEELRSWHDETGVGICLAGNEELLSRIETGRNRDAFARLNRRIAQRHVQRMPLREDVIAFCDAWGLPDPAMRKYLEKIALTPGAGGLGECKQIVNAASMLAASEQRGLNLADLRDAQMTRATRWIEA